MTEDDAFTVETFLPYLLTQASEEANRSFQNEYEDQYGMLRTEWRVMFHLGHYGVMSAQEICAQTKLHKTKISRAVQKLEEKRFLKRDIDEGDRRRERLSLTKTGLEAFHQLQDAAERHNDRLLDTLTGKELKHLTRALQKLAKIPVHKKSEKVKRKKDFA